jgi:cation/acetate symporter
MAIAFIGIWVFSKIDLSARARTDKAGYNAQYVRSETGIGSVAAVSH